MSGTEHVAGVTWHQRIGEPKNAFRYSVDYVLLDVDAPMTGQGPLRRNRRGIVSLWDRDHGGPVGRGRGASWARRRFEQHGVEFDGPLLLLAQPRVLGHVFNPVSFWLAQGRDETLRAVIAEVTNTYGDRHSYLCARSDGKAIGPNDRLRAKKIFHVSPFQPIAGEYEFCFSVDPEQIVIRIELQHDGGGVVASLAGPRKPLSGRRLMGIVLRRPLASWRVLALIHWQALKLYLRGAQFRPRPAPPSDDLSS